VHVCAGKPAGEPTEDYVKGAAMTAVKVISTICANRKGLPKHFRDSRGRPEGDYQVLFNEETGMSIHSEIVKKKSGQ